jgi:hypothetical protein
LPARLLEQAAEFPAVVKRVAAYLDEVVMAELPLASHAKAMLDKLKKRYTAMPSTTMAPDPDAEPQLYGEWVCDCGQRRNIHRHCFTCRKGLAGQQGCRLARPQPVREATGVTQIVGTSVREKALVDGRRLRRSLAQVRAQQRLQARPGVR